MKVLIVGAGIAGLSLAAHLRRQKIEAVVIEQARKWRNIGFVLTIWPFGMKQLREMNAARFLKTQGTNLSAFSVVDAQGAPLARLNLKDLANRYGKTVEIERETLHRALRKINHATAIKMGTTIRKLRQGAAGVSVTLSDGSRNVFDLVVGADGINSTIRKWILPVEKEEYEGLTFWMFWVPKALSLTEVRYYAGHRRYVALFPIAGKHQCAVFFMPAKKHSYIKERNVTELLRREFAGIGGDVARVLSRLPSKPSAFFHHDDNEMHARRWRKGNVVLIGDAAHALSSTTGMGASLAMEDAYVLAQELGRGASVATALGRYVARRQSRVAFAASLSWHLHRLTLLPESLYSIRNGVLKCFGSAYLWWMMNRIHATRI